MHIKISKSIRFELIFVIIISSILTVIILSTFNGYFTQSYIQPEVIYNYDDIKDDAKNMSQDIEKKVTSINLENDIQKIICADSDDGRKVFITDKEGKILFKNSNVSAQSIDLYQSIKDSEFDDTYDKNVSKEKKYIIPVNIDNEEYFLFYIRNPKSQVVYNSVEKTNVSITIIICSALFFMIFLAIINSKMKYLDKIAKGLKIIAGGKLDYRIEEKGADEISNIAVNVNFMAEEIGKRIEAEREAEKTKTQLITNVSHDLRTPLTSIMGYIGLIIEKRYDSKEQFNKYINIAYIKSNRLKMLIDDLFEYTKLSSNALKLNLEDINIVQFISQFIEEYANLFEEKGLTVRRKFEENSIMVLADTSKMLRVFENIISNIIKYAYENTEVTVSIYRKDVNVIVEFRNKGDNIPKEKAEKLFERFYRVDESRNAQTGGSGLGLAISKNIVELHNGKIWAKSFGNNIYFYISLKIVQ